MFIIFIYVFHDIDLFATIQGERELQEFRRIRYQQDLAYEESLAIDRERVCFCFYFHIAF